MGLIFKDAALAMLGGEQTAAGKLVDLIPEVEAVPLEPLCQWLAAYASPPKYAMDAMWKPDGPILSGPEERKRAWEYHFRNLLEKGFWEE